MEKLGMKVSAVFLHMCSAILTDNCLSQESFVPTPLPCSLVLFIGQEFGVSELPCVHQGSTDTHLLPTAQ